MSNEKPPFSDDEIAPRKSRSGHCMACSMPHFLPDGMYCQTCKDEIDESLAAPKVEQARELIIKQLAIHGFGPKDIDFSAKADGQNIRMVVTSNDLHFNAAINVIIAGLTEMGCFR